MIIVYNFMKLLPNTCDEAHRYRNTANKKAGAVRPAVICFNYLKEVRTEITHVIGDEITAFPYAHAGSFSPN